MTDEEIRLFRQIIEKLNRIERRLALLESSESAGGGVTDHGALSGLGDDDHSQYHTDARGDARYFRENEHLSSSAGAGDAGKPIVLDAAGHIDASMVNDGDVDHGSIGGLSDDDHTQYLLASGTRALTGEWDIGEDRAILLEVLRARDGEGIALQTDDNITRVILTDGGVFNVGNDPLASSPVHIGAASAFLDINRYVANLNGPGIQFRKSRHGTVGSHTVVQSGDELGKLIFVGSDGASFVLGAILRAVVDGTPGSSDMPGKFEFLVTPDGSSTPALAMAIDQAKRLHINQIIRALTSSGIRMEDDGGNLALFIQDATAYIGILNASPANIIDVLMPSGNSQGLGFQVTGGNNGFLKFVNATSTTNNFDPSVDARSSDSRTLGFNFIARPGTDASGSAGLRISPRTTGGAVLTAANLLEIFNSNVRNMTMAHNGNLALGSHDTPQGKLHAHDGTGGMLFVSKTGIVGSSQVIIPNASGDVTRALVGFYSMSDGSTGTASTFTLTPGNNQDITIGSNTWRLALNANGELSVIRQSGSGTGAISLLMLWI